MSGQNQAAAPDGPQASRRAQFSWSIYDWASNGFGTVILSFVFSAYFTSAVAATPEEGTSLWGWAIAASSIAVAILAPITGAVADQGGRVKPWLAITTLLCAVPTALLWFVEPSVAAIMLAVVLIAVANFGYEMSMVFYNALLPSLVPAHRMGRLSGWAWSSGYFGGLTILCIALFGFIQPEAPLFGLDKETAEHVRIAGPLAAAWFLVFALPLFFVTPDRPTTPLPLGVMAKRGVAALISTIRRVRQNANMFRFLIARLFYVDGLNTMFVFGGVFAAGTFGMAVADVIMFGIALNICAGLGAAAGGWVDDWIGPRRTIIWSLVGLMACGLTVVTTNSIEVFWIFGSALGLFMGPVQSASRSLMGRIAPPEMATEMFGLFATSGKATSFVGPALVAWIAAVTDSQRLAIASVTIFFVIGLILLLRVKDPAQ